MLADAPTPRSPLPRLRRAAQWLPLACAVALVVASFVTGRSPVPVAGGASYAGVQASLAGDVFLDATGCPPAAVAIGDLVPGTDPWKTAQDEGGQTCSIDFGTTNNVSGTSLTMLEDPAAPSSPAAALKCVGGPCAGSAISDYSGGGEPSAGTSAFGAQLLTTGGIATASWSAAPAVHAVQDAASTACATGAIGTGTCGFTWGATAAVSDPAGAYQAAAQLVVLAN